MAKKKELPKAMMGKIIKPVVRAIATGAKAAKKGYQESVVASKAGNTATASKKTREWPSLDGTPAKPKNSKFGEKIKPSKKAKAVGIAVGATAAAAGIYERTKKHRSLK